MRTTLILSGLVAAVYGQSSAPAPTGPPMGVYKTANNVPAVTATILSNVHLATATPAPKKRSIQDVANIKRQPFLARRGDLCVAQPAGMNYTTVPDDPASFQKDSVYSTAANMAATPNGYNQVFKNIVASNTAPNYLGFTLMSSYDVASCGQQCDAQSSCASFNIYFERDPTVYPDASLCPNPPSLTQIKCVFWGGLVSLDNANNYGQSIASFIVAIAGNNGYTNTARAAAIQAAATATPTVGAIATETASTKSIWLVYYSADSSQSAYTSVQAANTYKDCMTACDADGSCNAFSYVGASNGTGSGTCWLKTSLGNPTVSNDKLISAVRAVGSGNAASASFSPSPVVVSSTSSSTSTLSLAAPTQQLNYPVYGTQTTTQQYISTVTYSPAAGASTAGSGSVSAASSPATSSTAKTSSSSSTIAYPAPGPITTTTSATTTTVAPAATTPAVALKNGSGLSSCPTTESTVTATDGSSWSVCDNADYVGNTGTTIPGVTDPSVCASLCVASIKCIAAVMDKTNKFCHLKDTDYGALVWTVNSQYKSVRLTSQGPLASLTAVKTLSTAIATSTTSTTPTVLPTDSVPASGFYIQIGTKVAGVSAWATVNAANGRMQYTINKSKATVFYLDPNGALRNWNSNAAYNGMSAMTDNTAGSWQRLALRSSVSSSADQATCQFKDGMVQCTQSTGFVWAGSCMLDGFIYFGAGDRVPWGCGWLGLYPVSVNA